MTRPANPKPKTRIGRLIADRMAEKGLLQQDLASKLGIIPQGVSNWLNAQKPVPLHHIDAIAEFLDWPYPSAAWKELHGAAREAHLEAKKHGGAQGHLEHIRQELRLSKAENARLRAQVLELEREVSRLGSGRGKQRAEK